MRVSALILSLLPLLSACSDPTPEDTPPPEPTDGGKEAAAKVPGTLALAEVAAYQTTKVSLFSTAPPPSKLKVPLLAGKPLLLRTYVLPNATWPSGDIKAELHLEAPGGKTLPTLEATAGITKASADGDLKSTFNFTLAATSVVPGLKFSVTVFDDKGKPLLVYPEGGGTTDLGVVAAPRPLKLVVVPVRYDADKSGRLPDTSAEQMDLYRTTLLARYPVAAVDVTVHAPVMSPTAVLPNGSGFSTILKSMVQLRQADGAADDVYYYGVFQPAATFDIYCKGGCVLGLSGLIQKPQDAAMRASIGLGYPGDASASTMAHEIGHAHGRAHAPCAELLGIGGVDTTYPYPKGSSGVWGYDAVTKLFMDPEKTGDMMGYCDPEWVSDYTYLALYDRIVAVDTLVAPTPFSEVAQGERGVEMLGAPKGAVAVRASRFRMVSVDAEGGLSRDAVFVKRAPEGQPIVVTRELVNGQRDRAIGHFVAYGHLGGGLLFVPDDSMSAVRKISVRDLVQTGLREATFAR